MYSHSLDVEREPECDFPRSSARQRWNERFRLDKEIVILVYLFLYKMEKVQYILCMIKLSYAYPR